MSVIEWENTPPTYSTLECMYLLSRIMTNTSVSITGYYKKGVSVAELWRVDLTVKLQLYVKLLKKKPKQSEVINHHLLSNCSWKTQLA